MKREEWVDREIRTVVQGIHQVFGVRGADDAPVSPLTISGDPPEEEEEVPPAPPAPVPAAAPGARRAARRKHKRDRR